MLSRRLGQTAVEMTLTMGDRRNLKGLELAQMISGAGMSDEEVADVFGYTWAKLEKLMIKYGYKMCNGCGFWVSAKDGCDNYSVACRMEASP